MSCAHRACCEAPCCAVLCCVVLCCGMCRWPIAFGVSARRSCQPAALRNRLTGDSDKLIRAQHVQSSSTLPLVRPAGQLHFEAVLQQHAVGLATVAGRMRVCRLGRARCAHRADALAIADHGPQQRVAGVGAGVRRARVQLAAVVLFPSVAERTAAQVQADEAALPVPRVSCTPRHASAAQRSSHPCACARAYMHGRAWACMHACSRDMARQRPARLAAAQVMCAANCKLHSMLPASAQRSGSRCVRLCRII